MEEVGLATWRRVVYWAVYINNLRVVYEGVVKLQNVHTYKQDYKFYMENGKLGVTECLDKDVLACFDEAVVEYLDESVVERLDKNNKDYFDVSNLLVQPLVQILGRTLGEQFIVPHCYMKKIG